MLEPVPALEGSGVCIRSFEDLSDSSGRVVWDADDTVPSFNDRAAKEDPAITEFISAFV